MKKHAIILALMLLLALAGCDNSGDTDISSMSMPSTSSTSLTPDAPGVSSVALTPSLTPASSGPVPGNREPATGIEDEYLSGLGDLEGIVLGMNPDGGFTLSGGVPEVSPGGQFATTGEIIELDVVYIPDTVFLLMEYDMATNESEVFTAAVADVVQGRSVSIWGEYGDNCFIASVVRVVVTV